MMSPVTQSLAPTRHPAPGHTSWDWNSELVALDTAIAVAERQNHWDWQRELAELEAGLERVASQFGLGSGA